MSEDNQERKELWQRSKELGLELPRNINDADLRAAVAQTEVEQYNEGIKLGQPTPVKTVVWTKPDDLREAIKSFTDKDGFEYNITDTHWHFKYKGAEDSGTMSTPLRIIARKAEVVSRGRRSARSMGSDGQYSGINGHILAV